MKKIVPLFDFITAADAAAILSAKHGRNIRPGYVHKLKGVRHHPLNATSFLYHKADIESASIRTKHR